jgi:hypothetical protein
MLFALVALLGFVFAPMKPEGPVSNTQRTVYHCDQVIKPAIRGLLIWLIRKPKQPYRGGVRGQILAAHARKSALGPSHMTNNASTPPATPLNQEQHRILATLDVAAALRMNPKRTASSTLT